MRVAVAAATHHISVGVQADAPWKELYEDDLVRLEPDAVMKSYDAGTDFAPLVHVCAGETVFLSVLRLKPRRILALQALT